MSKAPAPAAPPSFTLESFPVTFVVLAEHVVGNGRIAWLDVRPSARHVSAPHALRDLAIEETGTVARLLARNQSAFPVLFPSDLVVGGGKQTRTVERSVVVAAGASTEIPVRCVERKRWSPGDGAGAFHVEGTLSSVTRSSFVRMKDRALDDRGAYGLDQNQVWAEVRDELTRTGVTSTTESYADFLRATRPPPAARRADYEAPPASANGVALFVGDDAWIEAYASEVHLVAQAPSLLDDFRARVDALGAPCADVAAALDDVRHAALVAIAAIDGTIGASYALRGTRAVGSALFLGDALAHLAVAV